jgi:hypothetical protein
MYRVSTQIGPEKETQSRRDVAAEMRQLTTETAIQRFSFVGGDLVQISVSWPTPRP